MNRANAAEILRGTWPTIVLHFTASANGSLVFSISWEQVNSSPEGFQIFYTCDGL